ncbi:YtfJ family protein [Photobacterium sp. S4TG1]|uniref:YtfJ family protein n=1 Tax=Photobacterium sp. S4TG1 TaxID=3114587 RepID=UPI002E176DAB|nr:YtfJ family protein [Photobacterium sp. S4TG1]
MYKILLTLIFIASIPTIAQANNLEKGTLLTPITITSKGELVLNNNSISYQPWHSTQLTRKVRIIMAIAGRSSAKKINADLIKAISDAHFPESKYQTTTIINQDDAVWGTSGFVKSASEDSKKQYPWSSIVLDSNGIAQKTWELQKESSAIIVLNQQGKILFQHEGQLSQQQIKQVISLVKISL